MATESNLWVAIMFDEDSEVVKTYMVNGPADLIYAEDFFKKHIGQGMKKVTRQGHPKKPIICRYTAESHDGMEFGYTVELHEMEEVF